MVWMALLVAVLDAVLVKAFRLDPVLVILYRGTARLVRSSIDLIRDTQVRRHSTPPIPQDGGA
jgi:hypothetical protein